MTLMVTAVPLPEATLPSAQVTVPEALEQPPLAETKLTAGDSVSVSVTPVAADGPALLTVSV
jgi:hypothetical protein